MKKILTIAASFVMAVFICGCSSTTSSSSASSSALVAEESSIVSEAESEDISSEVSSEVPSVDEEEITEPEEETSSEADTTEEVQTETSTVSMTMAQKNAYQSAKSYLSCMAFSRQGLIDQLSSEYGEGYEVEDATFAVETLEANGEADWNEEAYESAKSYLSYMAFSRQGLIDQLTSEYGEEFEADEAEYAINKLETNGEVDWNEQAYLSAKSYLEYSSFSLDGLIDQLESEYGEEFTHDQAVYGAEKAYNE